jgi:DNA-binding PadR family transcriptional regulator
MVMELLSADVLALISLAEGPASGSEIAARVRARAGDPRVLGPGTLYPALRRLRAAGLVRTWGEGGRARVGRPQRFNELTPSGIEELARNRTRLRALWTTPPPLIEATPAVVRQMRANLRRAFAVSAFGSKLRSALARRGRP